MNGGIFLIQDNGQLIEMTAQQYDSEDLLQELLAKYPNLLAGDQMDNKSPRRWLLISREASVPSEDGGGGRWSVDHLFLDQDGIPTLVEVKQSHDTRIRREVVGQMLDYAANAVVYWPVETILAKFEANNDDPERALNEFLASDEDPEQFWQKVKTNLRVGKVRLVFVADEIPSELRRVVEFLNEQMDPAEVLAVEIRQYVGENLKTLVPRVMGQTEEAQKRKAGAVRVTKQWDETKFLADLHSRNLEKGKIKGVETLLEQSKELESDGLVTISWGTGKETGSFTVKSKGSSFLSVFSNADLWLNMGGWKTIPTETRSSLASELGNKLKFDLIYADRSYPNIAKHVFSVDHGPTTLVEWLGSAIKSTHLAQ